MEEIKKLVDEWSKKYQELQKSKDEEIKKLVKELQELQRNKDEEIKQINEKMYKSQKELVEKEVKEKQLKEKINFYKRTLFITLAIAFVVVIYFLLLKSP